MIKRYPTDKIYEEISFIAYHFHWSYHDLMNMEHRERRRWCKEISKINQKINTEMKKR